MAENLAHIGYHVAVGEHYHSVSYVLIKKEIGDRITSNTIAYFYRGNRTTNYRRAYHKSGHTTLAVHMANIDELNFKRAPQAAGGSENHREEESVSDQPLAVGLPATPCRP